MMGIPPVRVCCADDGVVLLLLLLLPMYGGDDGLVEVHSCIRKIIRAIPPRAPCGLGLG